MSFYRTYRPQTIDEIDNARVREKVTELLNKDKKELLHAYLFSGPRGAGKTTAARIIAKMFNCTDPTKTGPCGVCEQCTSIAEGKNLDVLELDAASNRGIDEIRSLREGIGLAPAAAGYKVYIIDEVHMLTNEAFNALLKTLEEPPRHAVFVLATTDPHKVPVTIKSRCLQLSFTKAKQNELVTALNRIVTKEKIDIDEEALSLLASGVDGSFRDAVKLLEQASFQKGKITAGGIRTLLSLATENSITEFISLFLGKKTSETLTMVGKLTEEGVDIRAFLVQTLKELERLLVGSVKGEESPWKQFELQDAIRKLSQAFVEMKSTPIPQLPLELAVVEYSDSSLSSPRPPAGEAGKRESSDQPETPPVNKQEAPKPESPKADGGGLLTLEKLTDCWPDFIAALKPFNHSVAGVMRSTRPKTVEGGIVTIEAFYTFHKEKLSEAKVMAVLSDVLKKLFGEKVKVQIVLGKK